MWVLHNRLNPAESFAESFWSWHRNLCGVFCWICESGTSSCGVFCGIFAESFAESLKCLIFKFWDLRIFCGIFAESFAESLRNLLRNLFCGIFAESLRNLFEIKKIEIPAQHFALRLNEIISRFVSVHFTSAVPPSGCPPSFSELEIWDPSSAASGGRKISLFWGFLKGFLAKNRLRRPKKSTSLVISKGVLCKNSPPAARKNHCFGDF